MSTDPLFVAVASVLLIALSAFFVVIEFALLGARSHRLEDDAQRSRSARAALRGVNELTVMLAGAQLGITACTFALGAITKPGVEALLAPVFSDIGLPTQIASVASFVLSLIAVTFLHLVVGEMTPKSWAIAHPELAAKAIGLPSRAFIWPLRPLLLWINWVANKLVSASGIEPVNRAAVGGQDVDTIRQLVELSTTEGTLEEAVRSPLSGVLELEELTVDSLISPDHSPSSVPATGTVADIQDAAASSGHMRILVGPSGAESPGFVHVRDTLLEPADRPASEVARELFVIPTGTPVYELLAQLQARGEQIAAVCDGPRFIGVVTLSDILRRVLPMDLASEAPGS